MKSRSWNSLRIKIVAWSFVPSVIILSSVAWFTFYSYQRVLGDLAIKQYPEILQPKVVAFSQAFSGLLNPILVPILFDIDTNHDLPLETRAQNILEQAPGLDVFDGGIYFLDKQGQVVITQPTQPELIGEDWSDTPHFRSVNAEPNLGADTDLISVGSPPRKILCVAMAMTGQVWNEVVGAIYYCFTIYPATENAYYQKMKSLDLGSNVYVVDRNHQIIFSPDATKMGQDLSGETYIQQLSQGESKAGRFDLGTVDTVISYVPLFAGVSSDRASWYMLAEQSWSEIMEPTLPYRQLLLVLLALGAIVPVLVTAYGVRHITEPIQKLIRAAEQVTEGHFRQRIDVRTGDEIETLANQFNLMSAELDDSYSSLEKKVAARTRELAIMNLIVSVSSRSLDIQEVLDEALSETVDQMGFAAGAAYRIDCDPPATHLIAQRGFSDPSAIEPLSMEDLAGPADIVENNLAVSTFEIQELKDENISTLLSLSGLQRLFYVPLFTKGRESGFFLLGKHEPDPPAPEEISLLSSIGQQVGVAMENARLYEQAELTGVTAERSRLARELHDAVTQTLFSANLIADVIPRIWRRNPDEGMQNLEDLRQLTRGALAEMRTLLLEMRPESLERADLNSLITQLVDAFIGRVRVPVVLDIQGECELTHEVKLVFYRVAQEALNNIAKHAGARQVVVQLACRPDRLNLIIKDDGLGFEADKITSEHLGMAIMSERAASIGAGLTIDSEAGQGTSVELDWISSAKDTRHE